jgi:Tfp pilus assembly protein PilO
MYKFIHYIVFKLSQIRLAIYGLIALGLIITIVFIQLIPAKKLEVINLQKNIDLLLNQGAVIYPATILESPVAKFYKQLPDSAQLKPMLEFIFKLTTDKKLTIDTINYELAEQSEISFATYKIQAPVTGTYLDLMKFVQKILETYPNIALSNISISRENSQANLIDAEIELLVYLKKDL